MQICVIDVGGSHVSDGTFDVTDGQLLRRRTSTLFTDGSSHHPLKILHAIAEQSNGFSGEPIAGMSLAVPSPFDFVAGVSRMRHKLEQLYGIDLKRCLSEIAHIPFDSCVFLNDADAFLLGALTNSGSPNLPSLGIALGTGIGSAFADEGEILTSGIGVPPEGEIWNLSFEEGTIEDAISTKALVDAYRSRTGKVSTVKSIAEMARAGDQDAMGAFGQFGRTLGQVLSELCQKFPAKQIFLGGGICAAGDLFFPEVQQALSGSQEIILVEDQASAPLLGAGVAWQRVMSKRSAQGSSKRR